MKICAVVVTYNRKELLEKQIIEILHNQELKIDAYYVIDNCSTDGTRSLVKEYEGTVIKYCKTKSNCGGAGGFSYGLQRAFEDKYDWYILMDDDGRPMDKNCFENMKKHIVKKGYDSQKMYLLNSLVLSDNDTLSFGLGHIERITELNSVVTENEVVGMINPFNGTWISSGLVEKIGVPNGDFFIKGDENDYLRRAQSAGAFVATIVDSMYFHPKLGGYKKKKVFGKEMYVYIEPAWKEYYSVRNYTFSFLQFGKKKDAILFLIKRMYCSIDSVLLPTLAKQQDDRERVKNMTRRAIKISTYIMAPLMMGLAFCATSVVDLVLTEKWLPCVPFLQIFCITYMFYPIHTANLNAIKAMGRSDLFLKLEIAKKIVGMILLLSTMWFGVMAMAYSLLVSMITSMIINSWPNRQLLNYSFKEQMIDIFPSVTLAVVMGIAISFINFFEFSSALTLLIKVPTGALIYIFS